MTKKKDVNFSQYRKKPRQLEDEMMSQLVDGGLRPILNSVKQDDRLHLDIRDRRFNVYFKGGSLLCVDGRESPPKMTFDTEYFKKCNIPPPTGLPPQFGAISHSEEWVRAFPKLIAGMDDWWMRNQRNERMHCQEMARVNSARCQLPKGDYLVLDLEYQWAQRRFDMIAAKRNPTKDDSTGWVEPELAFIEVKSDCGACKGSSGLVTHASDYQDIIAAEEGRCVDQIKREFETVVAQKRRLGLLTRSLPFRQFSSATPELVIVFVSIDPDAPDIRRRIRVPLVEVVTTAQELTKGRILFMHLKSPTELMNAEAIFQPKTES